MGGGDIKLNCVSSGVFHVKGHLTPIFCRISEDTAYDRHMPVLLALTNEFPVVLERPAIALLV